MPDHDGLPATPDIYCQFPDYAGVVSWKTGFQLYRDAPVDPGGNELTFTQQDTQQAACLAQPDPDAPVCRIRFDRVRKDMFHDGLYGHTRGKPKSLFACLDGAMPPNPTGWLDEAARTCLGGAFNPEFNMPTSASGAGDGPGGDFVVTLGRWGFGFRGSEFVQASTTAHELGHTLWLFHGGGPPVPTSPITPEQAAQVRRNCKPNYLSVMSYLFQVGGLLDDSGTPHVNYSIEDVDDLDEFNLLDLGGGLPGNTSPYRPAWYAPAAAANVVFGSAATKFCNGMDFPEPLPPGWVDMARVDIPSVAAAIDWNANGSVESYFEQDINFDGAISGNSIDENPHEFLTDEPHLARSNDWVSLRLNQIGSRQSFGGFSAGFDFGGFDFGGFDFGGFDFGGFDFGGFDFGGFDFGGFDFGGAEQEIDLNILSGAGNAPAANQLTACRIGFDAGCIGLPSQLHRIRLDWLLPNALTVATFAVYRVEEGSSIAELVGTVNGATLTLVDEKELPDFTEFDVTFTYFVIATFVELDEMGVPLESGPSNFVTVEPVNVAAMANNDPESEPAYVTFIGAPLMVAAAEGVLANDGCVPSSVEKFWRSLC